MAMLRKFLCRDSDSFSASEEGAVSRLATTHRRLLMDGGRVNTKSEEGFNACAVFLDGLDTVARTMRLDTAPRTYRVAFTINYRALFPDEARNYRVDVLEASVEQYHVIWVNGDKFEFTAEAMQRAEALQRAWSELGKLLERWTQASEPPKSATRPARSELRSTLIALDFAWASFEHKYIAELIEIEEKARRLIVQAIEHEKNLQFHEAHHGEGEALQQLQEYYTDQKRLVACIAHLNSVANFRRKGRDDLSVEVLSDATATLGRCDAAELKGESTDAHSAARILATDVVESYTAVRGYLREVEKCLERVDPHLCNNVGLVAAPRGLGGELGGGHEVRAEREDAERGVRPSVGDQGRAEASPGADLDVRGVRRGALPRPAADHLDPLPVQAHAPHGAPEKPAAAPIHRAEDNSGVHTWDSEIETFLAKFRAAKSVLMTAQGASSAGAPSKSAEKMAWETLVKRVVAGTDGKEDAYGSIARHLQDGARKAVEDLIHELERWSIELQRHCPEDWNQCSAILVQCLTGGGHKVKQAPFRV
eukprot:CAMPEP_0179279884 /NCGR_PEP_ID=MMETSP0797-20121207/36345_1 /TAXON_ID=47934 /ORGANISM="Dinophysis acuminata, Strain DAEP01" /LENGTH=536 /DNA_ID=CAMNT_0020988529 /DNA_START=58 /DNA_END=1668 /DNA_ORIENTATION=+